MSENDHARQAGDEFLEKVRTLVEYWNGQAGSMAESGTSRHRLEGLAHSILTAIDQGNLSLVHTSLLEDQGLQDRDISGELNDLLFNRGRWAGD